MAVKREEIPSMADEKKDVSIVRECPKCGIPLEQCHEGDATLDQCPTCLGVWFDEGEVQRVLDTKWSLERYVPYHARAWEKGESPCPVCGRAMLVLRANSAFPFDIDICPVHKGHWIDGDEIQQMMDVIRTRTLRLKEPPPEPAADEDWRLRKMRERVQDVGRKVSNRGNHTHPALEAAFQEPAMGISYSDLGPGQIAIAFLGIPVERDELYRWRSFVNLLIIGFTVYVHYRMVASGNLRGLIQEWGFIPREFSSAPDASSVEAVASMFIHVNFAHLLGNMLFLFLAGDDIERRTGHFLYPFFYLACGVAATVTSYLHGHGSNVPHIGASGAVAGVMGAYLVLFYYKHLCFRWWWRLIILPSWVYLLFWLGSQALSMKFSNAPIDYAAHVGGFVFGAVSGCVIAASQTFSSQTGEWHWKF